MGSKITTRARRPSRSSRRSGGVRQRRCLVPANGYFEWRAGPRENSPTSSARGAAALAFAGLWETRKDGDLDVHVSLLTAAARGELARIHDRQPVMLRPAERDA